MTDHNTESGPQGRPAEVTESEMDAQRSGNGLGDTVHGRDIDDIGRPDSEPGVPGGGPAAAPPDRGGAADAGEIEDMGADQAGPDDIEDQTGTDSGSSGLQNYA